MDPPQLQSLLLLQCVSGPPSDSRPIDPCCSAVLEGRFTDAISRAGLDDVLSAGGATCAADYYALVGARVRGALQQALQSGDHARLAALLTAGVASLHVSTQHNVTGWVHGPLCKGAWKAAMGVLCAFACMSPCLD